MCMEEDPSVYLTVAVAILHVALAQAAAAGVRVFIINV